MRNQPLIGYVLHQKPYGENRSLIYFFSQELGMVHGIGKKNLPLFMPIQLFASGKRALKTFSQSQLCQVNSSLVGQGLFAGMYLNEILLKLLPIEEPFVQLWSAYQTSIEYIAQLFHPTLEHTTDLTLLKWQLRRFETVFFEQLGYGLDFSVDAFGDMFDLKQNYHYQLEKGFVALLTHDKAGYNLTGEELNLWQQSLQDPLFFEAFISQQPQKVHILLHNIGGIYRNILDSLLNYQPLQSRKLWQQQRRFLSS